MPQIYFGLKDLFSAQARRGIVFPTAPVKSGSNLLIPDRFTIRDAQTVNLPAGDYRIEFPGSQPYISGHFSLSADSNFADIFIQDGLSYELPPQTPISNIAGLGAILDSKLDEDDPRLDLLISPEEFQPANTRLSSIASQANPSSVKNIQLRTDGTIGFADPASGSSSPQSSDPIALTVTADNTLSALPYTPSAPNRVMLMVNGKSEVATGLLPAFSVSGTTITWIPNNAGYNLIANSHEVYALVW